MPSTTATRIDAAIVIAQPGSAEPDHARYVLRDSTDDHSTSIQLVRTAEQADRRPGRPHPRARGALGRPLAPGASRRGRRAGAADRRGHRRGRDLLRRREAAAASRRHRGGSRRRGARAVRSRGAGGRPRRSTSPTVDLEHGPETYVQFSGNLIPGLGHGDAGARAVAPRGRRRDRRCRPRGAAPGRRAARARLGVRRWRFPPRRGAALPLRAALLGIVASPAYPFDPGRFGVGVGELSCWR